MDKDSAVKNFLGELSEENKDPINPTQEDPFVQQEIEPKGEVIEEKLPFHKDPKIQKFIDKEISKRLQDLKPEVPQAKESEEDNFKDVIDSFSTIIGNDTPEKVNALSALKKSLSSLDQRASEKAIERLASIRAEEVRADKEAEQELETAFDNIEESYDVDFSSAIGKKTKQEFASFIEKIAPKNTNGEVIDYPDMNSAWETFSELKKSNATPSRAKELASRSMARSSSAESTKDIKGLGFDNIIEHLGINN